MPKQSGKKGEEKGLRSLDLPEPRDFIPRLIRAHNNLINAFEKLCGIHMARWRLLFNLARRGSSSQNDLSRSTTMAPAAVTRILADMERQQLIRRKPSAQDSRQMIVELTPAGEQLVMETAVKREQFLQQALAGFSDAEIILLERLLGDLETNLGAAR
ncbi:MarR family winged helix-turn-helix transcriptional regulator [Sphingopyxis sp.]|uniref:MarR family winged helix-turn-helix transcriptional regulator n=1 Tax=Sphingopyxis sp. TaxID=1908224 RepID=UPI00263589EF|nr:MarR family winged helix-turn-helix transcriptional regulator [Sphingopyxis sp.]MCW0199426.1 MarR family winged helix-turn-helix transcriptional regulator [Sphingopyxis sp.]